MSSNVIEIDGAAGEGGGQILRTSLTLALLTGKPFHLRNIRAGRAKPGLQPQHLMCVRAAAAIGQAQCRGASLQSSDLVFEPGAVLPGNHRFDIGTAGAVSLLLHSLYLPLALRAHAPSQLTLVGGTHVNASPCFHFLDTTWRPLMAMLGLHVRLKMRRAGFYPRGGGLVEVEIQPCLAVQPLQALERGPVAVTGFSAVAGLSEDIAARQARRAVHRLKQARLNAEIDTESWPGGPGTVLGLIADTKPVPVLFFALGARGKRAERVADEAVEQLLAYLEAEPAAVDPHSGDQLVLPLALAAGPSRFTVSAVTEHLLTNIAVIRQFVEREIACEGELDRPGVVSIG
jgi:RNA 3'-terminal phosphate cyclase (ATP)